MMTALPFAVNQSCLPHKPLEAFLALARSAGAVAVELRNDLQGQPLGGDDPTRTRAQVEQAGLTIASVNALQNFNIITADRLEEADALFRIAAELGAPGVVLCPNHTIGEDWTEADRARNLRESLRALEPILARHGVRGLVEPLGMRGTTLNRQAAAVEAVDETVGWQHFGLCHDTFQFWRASDPSMFPQHVALVHISGIPPGDVDRRELRDADRGFVYVGDRSENVKQLIQLRNGGYSGFVSMEPFNEAVQTDPRSAARLQASFDYLSAAAKP